jgi:hypothetical protein
MKASILFGLTIVVVALLGAQAAITQADEAATAQITFYVH